MTEPKLTPEQVTAILMGFAKYIKSEYVLGTRTGGILRPEFREVDPTAELILDNFMKTLQTNQSIQ